MNRPVPKLPSTDYSGLRRILDLDHQPYEPLKHSDEPIVIAVDLTGVKAHRAGGWVERKHGKKRLPGHKINPQSIENTYNFKFLSKLLELGGIIIA